MRCGRRMPAWGTKATLAPGRPGVCGPTENERRSYPAAARQGVSLVMT
jgi:hypothetical protein